MDVSAVTLLYLEEATGMPWFHDVPPDAPAEFGTLTRDGGPSELVRDMPTMTLMTYAQTRGRAALLASTAKHALIAMPWSVDAAFSAEILGDYYDPMDGRHRHRITAQLIFND